MSDEQVNSIKELAEAINDKINDRLTISMHAAEHGDMTTYREQLKHLTRLRELLKAIRDTLSDTVMRRADLVQERVLH